jgi:hypothetical protein
MADPKLSDDDFKLMLAQLHNRGLVQPAVAGERVDHETLVALFTERDPKLAKLVEEHLASGRKVREYIEQRYIVAGQAQPQPMPPPDTKSGLVN